MREREERVGFGEGVKSGDVKSLSFSLSRPSGPSGPEGKYKYRAGEEIRVSRNPQEDYYRALRVKKQKIEAWWVERGRHYLDKFRFVGLTLTFRDEASYLEFEKWGGRRAFMKAYKRYCQRLFGRDVIVDYVCVSEFQSRGVIHYHYLLVVVWGVRLPFPDKAVFRWGMSNLVALKGVDVKGYLTRYVQKMEQLSYELYSRWKELVGRFRLYEFARKIESGVLGLLNRGWGRYLYWKVLRFVEGWKFSAGKLYVRYKDELVSIKALWDSLWLGGELLLRFRGFRVVVSGVEQFSFKIESLDELIGFVSELFEF